VAVRPGIARPAALAVHVAEAVLARAERGEWRCAPDEPEWLVTETVTEALTVGVSRPAVLLAEGTLDQVGSVFVDCRWPARYLPWTAG
jgi:hypothetical protein